MSSTLMQSGKKLSGCSEKSKKFHLENPKVDQDFWSYYLQNKRAFDNIILVRTMYLEGHVDLEDLHNDILLRFHRCGVLGQFNPKKSKINTYVTGCVVGYAKSYLYKKNKDNLWNPWPTQDVIEEDKHYLSQVQFASINGICPSIDPDNVPEDISVSDPIEERLDLKEKVALVRSKLTGESLYIFNMLLEGCTKGDLASIFGVIPQLLSLKAKKLKDVCRKVFQD